MPIDDEPTTPPAGPLSKLSLGLKLERVANPPALVITAQYDPIRDQGKAYADALEAAGVDVTYTNYDGVVHIFFQLGPLVDKGAQAVTQTAQFARACLD